MSDPFISGPVLPKKYSFRAIWH